MTGFIYPDDDDDNNKNNTKNRINKNNSITPLDRGATKSIERTHIKTKHFVIRFYVKRSV